MKMLIPFLTVFMRVFATACSSVNVKTDYDRSVGFTGFKSYRWASGRLINPDDELAKRPFVQKRIRRSVDQVLE